MALVVTRPAGKSQTEPPRPLEVVALQGKDRAADRSGNREASRNDRRSSQEAVAEG